MHNAAKLLIAALIAAPLAGPIAKPSLDSNVKRALNSALENQYRAEVFDAAVIGKFGAVRPFPRIMEADHAHSASLRSVMRAYDMPVSAIPLMPSARVAASVPTTLAETCAAAYRADAERRDQYDQTLIPTAADYPDIAALFATLRDASTKYHLPALQRCRGGEAESANADRS